MRFSGEIGFVEEKYEETRPGVWRPKIVERHYTGDLIENIRKNDPVPEQQNDNIVLNNKISILSDQYAKKNWKTIKYVVWEGVKWKVTSINISFPRIYITLGGVYNGS